MYHDVTFKMQCERIAAMQYKSFIIPKNMDLITDT